MLTYTVDDNIVFGKGQYNPHTTEGKTLIAHELTHVVQKMPRRMLESRMTVIEKNEHHINHFFDKENKYSVNRWEIAKNFHSMQFRPNPLGLNTLFLSYDSSLCIPRVAGVDDAAAAVGVGAVLEWCLSGAVVSVLLDEISQLGKWLLGDEPFETKLV